jgi:signal transduction histidine kinase
LKPRLIIIFLLIVVVPLALLAGLGLRLARAEQKMVQQQFQDLLASRLRDVDAVIADLLAARERELLRTLELPAYDASMLRDLVRGNPFIRQVFLLDPKAKLLHPPTGALSAAEREFLERAGQVWNDRQIFYHGSDSETSARDHGWYTWYWGNGLNLLFWRRDKSGNVIGAELDRSRLSADIVAKLPGAADLAGGRIVLSDSTGNTIYQWGDYEPSATEPSRVAIALQEPLQTWRLSYFAPNAAPALRGRALWALLVGWLAVGLALAMLAVYFYRESTREMREAAQRVSFVNQVSHELKTPLTNIRLYAEMLEESVQDPQSARHVGVIVSESQRLSRLIGNVLSFARHQNGRLTLHKKTSNVDAVLSSVIEDFKLSLAAKGVDVSFRGAAGAAVVFDADALEQIVSNLFINVEKYAADGKRLEVASQQDHGDTLITVTDFGPGIPAHERENIFRSFYRLSDKLSDGVTGTGIGLTIARELARLHGGDLVLLPTERGACFQVRLRTPPS